MISSRSMLEGQTAVQERQPIQALVSSLALSRPVCAERDKSADAHGRIGTQPVEVGSDVAHGILAQPGPVIQADEPLAVAGRAANVGEEDGDPELVDQVVVATHEAGARLRFRPAVDVHDQRPRAGEAARIGADVAAYFFPKAD